MVELNASLPVSHRRGRGEDPFYQAADIVGVPLTDAAPWSTR
ncbi:MAG: hypothetical protein ACREYE_24985 [Gammaproteobacteria bacterium]